VKITGLVITKVMVTVAVGWVSRGALADPIQVAQAIPAGAMPPTEIVLIVRSAGLVPTSEPIFGGTTYVVRAVDPYGTPIRVIVDARYGYILSVNRIAVESARPPYEPSGPRGGPARPADGDDYANEDANRRLPPLPVPGRPPIPPDRSMTGSIGHPADGDLYADDDPDRRVPPPSFPGRAPMPPDRSANAAPARPADGDYYRGDDVDRRGPPRAMPGRPPAPPDRSANAAPARPADGDYYTGDEPDRRGPPRTMPGRPPTPPDRSANAAPARPADGDYYTGDDPDRRGVSRIMPGRPPTPPDRSAAPGLHPPLPKARATTPAERAARTAAPEFTAPPSEPKAESGSPASAPPSGKQAAKGDSFPPVTPLQ
jgi:hypothetical protein